MKDFKSKIRQVISSLPMIFALVVFIHHLTCTLLYLAPTNPATRYYSDYAESYINPFFAQRWLLFAPEPQTSQIRIWYRCKISGGWSDWRDPSYEIIEKHQNNRFSYYGKALFVFTGISRDLYNLKIENLKNEEFNNYYEYSNARKAISSLCLKDDSGTSKIQFSLLNLRVKNFSERASKGYYGKISRIDFPETSI